MTNEAIARKYIEWIAENYLQQVSKLMKYCKDKSIDYDEDVFSNTYLNIYEKILRDGLKDSTPKGFDNYTFKSFKMNLARESQYARNKYRNNNIKPESIHELYDEYYNEQFDDSNAKLMNDLFKDFTTLFIAKAIEENFNAELNNLFKLKMLNDLTYKQIRSRYAIKNIRDKIATLKTWIRENITKELLKEEFQYFINQKLL